MPKPDYAHWGAQPQYSLLDAAFLCCDLEPENITRDNPLPPRVKAMQARLNKEVSHTPSVTRTVHECWLGEPNVRTHYHTPYFLRENLRKWAERTGQRGAMPFLFPEDWDTGAEDFETESLRADGKETMLFLIGMLALTLMENPNNAKPKPKSEVYRMLARRAKGWGLDTKGTNQETEIVGLGSKNFYRLLDQAEREVENNKTGDRQRP